MRKRGIKKIFKDTKGVTTVEIILILVVLLAIVVIFREQLVNMVESIFYNINSSISDLY